MTDATARQEAVEKPVAEKPTTDSPVTDKPIVEKPAVVKPPEKKRTIWDGMAPIVVPSAICFTCGARMRIKIDHGKLLKVFYYCDTCEYGFDAQPYHLTGSGTKYEP